MRRGIPLSRGSTSRAAPARGFSTTSPRRAELSGTQPLPVEPGIPRLLRTSPPAWSATDRALAASSAQALHAALLSVVQREHLQRLQGLAEPPTPPTHATEEAHIASRPPEPPRTAQPSTATADEPPPPLPRACSPTTAAESGASRSPLTSRDPPGPALLHHLLRRRRDALRRERAAAAVGRDQQGEESRIRAHAVADPVAGRPWRRRGLGASESARVLGGEGGCSDSNRMLAEPSASANEVHAEPTAAWAVALKLFSEAIHDNAVVPTAPHFTLLLRLVMQDALWDQMDQVEDFYARLLASTQELLQEKELELAEANTVGIGSSWEDDHTSAAAGDEWGRRRDADTDTDTDRAHRLHREIDELASIESALRPTRQTFALLMQAALQRGAWARVLTYFEDSRAAGLPVTDAEVRLVLQACFMGGARTEHTGEDGDGGGGGGDLVERRPLALSPHHAPGGRTRLRTNQRGPQLRAAAQPRASGVYHRGGGRAGDDYAAGDTTSVSPAPLWRVGLTCFTAFRHAVQSAETVWCMVRLLESAACPGELLRVYAEMEHVLPVELPSGRGADTDAAVMQVHLAVSAAAREEGHWPLALRLWRSAARSWCVLDVKASLWGGVARGSGSTGLVVSTPSHPALEQGVVSFALEQGLITFPGGQAGAALLSSHPAYTAAAAPLELQTVAGQVRPYAQELLVNALHALRRVRRYSAMVELYRNRRVEAEAEVTLWTPRALTFVAQAAMAEGDLPLLLDMVGLGGDGEVVKDEAEAFTSPGQVLGPPHSRGAASLVPPVDVFDAAMRTLQVQLITGVHARRGQAGPAAVSSASPAWDARLEEWATLSHRVYKAFVHTAARELDALDRRATPTEAVEELLTAAHLPAVRLRVAATAPTPASSAPASLARAALDHFSAVRRPDAVLLALTMDGIASALGEAGQAPTRTEAADLAERVLACFEELVRAEEAALAHTSRGAGAGERDGRGPDSGSDPLTRGRTARLALRLTAVSAAGVEAALTALESLGQPFAALRLLHMATSYQWLPPARVVAWQGGVHRQAREVAQRAREEAEGERSIASAVVASSQADVQAGRRVHAAGPAHVDPCGAVDALVTLAAIYRDGESHGGSGGASADVADAADVAHGRALVEEAVGVMQRLQAGPQHPPTAAVERLLQRLTDAHRATHPHTNSLAPTSSATAVVTVVNAVVQQVSVTTVSRWALWPQCLSLVQLLTSPLDYHGGDKELLGGRPSATAQTLRVLAGLVRFCDRAEAGLVGGIALDWLALPPPTTLPSPPGGSSRVRAAAHRLLLDCLVWACRHREKALVRRLLANAHVGALLFPSHPAAAAAASGQTDGLSPTPEARLGDTGAALVIVLQCLSSGEHGEVLGDWPTLAKVLQELLGSAHRGPASPVGITAELLEAVSAVLVKLQRSLTYLLRGIAFSAHRRHARARASAESSSPTAEYVEAVERTVDEFLTLCEAHALPRMLASLDEHSRAPHVATPGRQPGDRLLRAALANTLDAAYEVLYAHFTWCVAFRVGESGRGPTRARTPSSREETLRRRSHAFLVLEVSLASPSRPLKGSMGESGAATAPGDSLTRHLHMWAVMQSMLLTRLVCGDDRASQPTLAAATLCAEITTMEALYGVRAAPPAAIAIAENNTTATGVAARGGAPGVSSFIARRRPPRAAPARPVHSTSLLLSVLETVQALTMEVVQPPDSSSRSTPASPATANAHDGPLPPLSDGCTSPAMLFLRPSTHLRLEEGPPRSLPLLHTVAHHLLYVALCEGREELPLHHPALVRRVLALPGSSWTGAAGEGLGAATLRALEGVGLPVLQSAHDVAEVLRGTSDIAAWCAGRPGAVDPQPHVHTFLKALATSKTFRGRAQMDETVAVEAILCLAHAPLIAVRDASEGATPRGSTAAPVDHYVASLLLAHPALVVKELLPRWQQGRLTCGQQRHLDEWMHQQLMGGLVRSPAAGAGGGSVALRRSAAVWLLGTRGSLVDKDVGDRSSGADGAGGYSPVASSVPTTVDTAAVLELAAGGEHDWTALLTLPADGLRDCHRPRGQHKEPSSDTHSAVWALMNAGGLTAAGRGVRARESSSAPAGTRSVGSDGEELEGASDKTTTTTTTLLRTVLTRSTAVQLLAFLFPEEVSQRQAAASPPRRPPAVALDETALHALLSAAAGPQLTDATKAAVEQANALRRSEQAIMRELAERVEEQRWAGAGATPTVAVSPRRLAALLAKTIQAHASVTEEEASTSAPATLLRALVADVAWAGGGPEVATARGTPAVTCWAEALPWLTDKVLAAPLDRSASDSPPAPAPASMLEVLEGFVRAHSAAVDAEVRRMLQCLLLVLHRNGRRASELFFTTLYPRIRRELLTARRLTDWATVTEDHLRFLRHLAATHHDHHRDHEGPSGARWQETAVASFGLRRLAVDLALVELGGGAHEGGEAHGTLRERVRELQRGALATRVGQLLRALVGPEKDAPDHALGEQVVRAWVQASVLLGAWKDLAFAADRLSGGSRAEREAVLALRTAAAVASLDRPRLSTAARECTAATSDPHVQEVTAALTAQLRRVSMDVDRTTSRAWGRHPSLAERLILTRALALALEAATSHPSRHCAQAQEGHPLCPFLLAPAPVGVVRLAVECSPSATTTTTPPPPPPPLALENAVATLLGATPAEYAGFVRLESLRRAHGRSSSSRAQWNGKLLGADAGQDGAREVQRAWTALTDAVAADPANPGVERSTLKRLFRSMRYMPHTQHFIPAPLSEALVLYACDNFIEALAVADESRSTLAHTRDGAAASPVQPYMMYLLLKRLRSCGRAGDATFAKGVEAFAWTAPDDGVLMAGQSAVPRAAVGPAAVACAVYQRLVEGTTRRPVAAQFVFTELLRASTSDPEVTRFLYACFWQQGYRRLEGVHVFLSLLRAASVARCEELALRAMRDVLTLLLPDTAAAAAVTDTILCAGARAAGDVPRASLTSVSHSLSPENGLAVWKSFAAACRAGVVCEAAARRVVAAFKHQSTLGVDDVVELLVMVAYERERKNAR